MVAQSALLTELQLVIGQDNRYYHLADRLLKLDYGKRVYDDDQLMKVTQQPILTSDSGARFAHDLRKLEKQ